MLNFDDCTKLCDALTSRYPFGGLAHVVIEDYNFRQVCIERALEEVEREMSKPTGSLSRQFVDTAAVLRCLLLVDEKERTRWTCEDCGQVVHGPEGHYCIPNPAPASAS